MGTIRGQLSRASSRRKSPATYWHYLLIYRRPKKPKEWAHLIQDCSVEKPTRLTVKAHSLWCAMAHHGSKPAKKCSNFSPHLPSHLLPLAKLNRNRGMLWPRGCNSRVQTPGAECRVKMCREQYPQGHWPKWNETQYYLVFPCPTFRFSFFHATPFSD